MMSHNCSQQPSPKVMEQSASFLSPEILALCRKAWPYLSLEEPNVLRCIVVLLWGTSRSHLGDLNATALFPQILSSFSCQNVPSYFSLFC